VRLDFKNSRRSNLNPIIKSLLYKKLSNKDITILFDNTQDILMLLFKEIDIELITLLLYI